MAENNFPIIDLSKALYSSSRLLIQRIQLVLNEVNLTYPQFLTLSILWEEDGLKVHQLGKKLNLDSGTLTPLLKKLESYNLVKRKRGETDERTVEVHLTYPGKSLQTKTMEALLELEREFVEELGFEAQQMLPQINGLVDKLNSPKN
jgi:MarR family transcriptional regulator, organic hydroperoxide resistance regulator